MSPQRHLLCGTILGLGSLIVYRDPEMALSSLVGSVAPDVDHIFEYAKYCNDYDAKPSLNDFMSGEYYGKKGTIYVFLHGWELAVLGLLVAFMSRPGGG